MNHSKSRDSAYAVVLMGLLVALEVVLTRFLSIRTPLVTIGFGFIPVCLAGMMFGPLRAGLVGAAADFLGAILFPIAPFFPGFTLTALLAGVVYGLFFYRRPLKVSQIVLAVLLVNLLLNLGLNTFWLYMTGGAGTAALLPARLIKCAVMIPIQFIAMLVINASVGARLPGGMRAA